VWEEWLLVWLYIVQTLLYMVAEGTSGSMISLYVVYNVIITILSVKCKLHGCRNNEEYVLIYLDILYKDIRVETTSIIWFFSCMVYINTYIIYIKNINVFSYGVCGYRKFKKFYLSLSLCKTQYSTNICFWCCPSVWCSVQNLCLLLNLEMTFKQKDKCMPRK